MALITSSPDIPTPDVAGAGAGVSAAGCCAAGVAACAATGACCLAAGAVGVVPWSKPTSSGSTGPAFLRCGFGAPTGTV